MLDRALYRSSQAWHALRPSIDADQLARACAYLSGAEARLFSTMPKRDQRHCIAVFNHLWQEEGLADADLLTAALIHDCGKGAVPIWLRVLNVLSPTLIRLLATEPAESDRRPPSIRAAAYNLLHHPEIGAGLARTTGSNARVVGFISGSVSSEDQPGLKALLKADDRY